MINIPQQAAQTLLDAARGGESLIPPYIPTFYWVNGDKKMKLSHAVTYYGGWATDAIKFESIIANFDKPFPPVLEEFEQISKDGSPYNVYGSRSIYVMPIKHIWLWRKENENGMWEYSQKFSEGSRSVLWWLSIFADRIPVENGYEYVPWGPVLLKALGYQSTNLKNSIKTWNAYTEPVREEMTNALRKAGSWKHSDTISASWFWMPVGTFGSEVNTLQVGNVQKSPITPISPYVPEGKLTEKIMSSLYVGEEVLNYAVKPLKDTEPWFDSFDNVVEEEVSDTVDTVETVETPRVDGDGIPW